nr:condensation domain-containing protein [Bacillus pacificus]
ETVQRIWDKAEFEMEYTEAAEGETERIIDAFIRPFKLDQLPLVRMALIKLSDAEHLLLFDMHHIISDGTSMSVLIKEFVRMYEGEALPPLRIQYKDYAVWQTGKARLKQVQKQETYWLGLD